MLCEPHAICLNEKDIVVLARVQAKYYNNYGGDMRLLQSVSTDGGKTFSTFKETGVMGGPAFLMRHSSGTIVCTYGYRGDKPYADKVMFSDDGGKTWDTDYVLNDKSVEFDHGYPSTVELEDGSLFTVYYQTRKGGQNHKGLYYTVWKLEKNN